MAQVAHTLSSLSYLAAAGLALADLAAQGFPAAHRTRESNWASFGPISSSLTPYRWLQVHDDAVGPLTITSISFRQDAWSDLDPSQFDYVLTLGEASSLISAANPPRSFAAAYGAPPTVMPLRQANIAGNPHQPGMPIPHSALATLPLAQPFVLRAGARLVWELLIVRRYNMPGHNWFDAARGAEPFTQYGYQFGSGCGATMALIHNANLAVFGSGTLQVNVSLDALAAPPNAPVAFWFGLGPLLPPLQLAGGAPGCLVHTLPILTFAGLADRQGVANLNLGTIILPAVSFNLYSQAATLDSSGLITSNGYHNYVGLAAPITPVGTLFEHPGVTPTPLPNEGLFVELR